MLAFFKAREGDSCYIALKDIDEIIALRNAPDEWEEITEVQHNAAVFGECCNWCGGSGECPDLIFCALCEGRGRIHHERGIHA